MSRQVKRYPIPICAKHNIEEKNIGCEGGKYIYKCQECLKEDLKAIWGKPNKKNSNI